MTHVLADAMETLGLDADLRMRLADRARLHAVARHAGVPIGGNIA